MATATSSQADKHVAGPLQATYNVVSTLTMGSASTLWNVHHPKTRMMRSHQTVRQYINWLTSLAIAQYMQPMLLVWWGTNDLPFNLRDWLLWSMDEFSVDDPGAWRDPIEYLGYHLEMWRVVWRDPELKAYAKHLGLAEGHSMCKWSREEDTPREFRARVELTAKRHWKWMGGGMDVEMVDVDAALLLEQQENNLDLIE